MLIPYLLLATYNLPRTTYYLTTLLLTSALSFTSVTPSFVHVTPFHAYGVQVLHDLVAPFVHRRTAELLRKALPPKYEAKYLSLFLCWILRTTTLLL